MSKVSLGAALAVPSFYDFVGDLEKAKKAEALIEEHLANHSRNDGESYLFIEVTRAEKSLMEPHKRYPQQSKGQK